MSKRSKWNRAPPKRHEHLQLKMCYSRSGNARRKKTHTPSYDSFGGKIFHWFRFVLFCFTLPLHLYVLIAYIYATVRQTSKNTVNSHENIANSIYTEHSLVFMLDRNTLMQKKKPLQLTFFFSLKKCFFCSILHTDKNRNDSTAQ